jgi:hypothetical protein
MRIHDVHCHFFSRRFFQTLGGQMKAPPEDPGRTLPQSLGWDAPGEPEDLAARWITELDRHQVSRAALIASVPGDEESVAAAVRRYPHRFVGFFMVDPTRDDAVERVRRGLTELRLRTVCLFPAMHRYTVQDPRAMKVLEEAAAHPGAAVFVHCGLLSVGVRAKLGLPSVFDMSCGNPLLLHPVALTFPRLPVIIPHLGAGLFREALMVADLCPNVYFDTSSSNNWLKYNPGFTLRRVLRKAIDVLGPSRLLFGTDSSFFPRGWQSPIFEAQRRVLQELSVDPDSYFHGNFERLFGPIVV